jgi:RNA polymerase sigma-70 factor (ECF subfamily)
MSLSHREERPVPLTDEDRIAVEAVRRGSMDRFRDLVDRHGDAVYATLRRLAGSPELAEELAQETFVRAFEHLDEFRGEAGFRTWLVQIALNLVRDRRRRARRSPAVISLEELRARSHGRDDPPEQRPSVEPIARLAQREISARLERELDRLPADYREAFVLKHVEGLPYEEIARVTGQTVGCLKVRVHRARARLRRALADVGRQEQDHGRVVGTIPRR